MNLELNYFFINFENLYNQEDIIKAYEYFYYPLGRFPVKLSLAVVPKAKLPKLIKTKDAICPNALYQKFRGAGTKGLVSTQVLAALNINLGNYLLYSKNVTTKFLYNLSMQTLSKSKDEILLKFNNITILVTNIIGLLRKIFNMARKIT